MVKLRRNKGTRRATVLRMNDGVIRTMIKRRRDGASRTMMKACNKSSMGRNNT